MTQIANEDEKMLTCQETGCTYTDTRDKMIDHLVLVHKKTERQAIERYAHPLYKAAKNAGAVPIPGEFEKTKTIKQALGDSKVKFFPELPRLEWAKLVNQRFIIKSIKIVEDWDSRFGTSDFPLMRIELEDGKEGTTLGSGIAILKQAKKLINQMLLPVQTTLIQQRSDQGSYYLLT